MIDILLSPEYKVFFTGDASWSYWAIPIRPGDKYKTDTISPHGQYARKRMAMGPWDSGQYAHICTICEPGLPSNSWARRRDGAFHTKAGVSALCLWGCFVVEIFNF